MRNIKIILNRPTYSGNIGSVACCAKNMAIKKLIVMDPFDIDVEESAKMAIHAALDVVERIRYVSSLREARASFQFILGTTAGVGSSHLRQSMVPSTELAEIVAPLPADNRIVRV